MARVTLSGRHPSQARERATLSAAAPHLARNADGLGHERVQQRLTHRPARLGGPVLRGLADEPPQEHGRETAELLGLRRREALPQLRRALRAVRLGELRVLRLGGTTRRIVRREERGERGRKRGRHGKCCFKITNEDSQQLLERGRLPRHATPTSKRVALHHIHQVIECF